MALQKITPFLWFDTQVEEAANFYVSIFPNSKIVKVVPGPQGKALKVEFELEGLTFVALNGGPHFKFTEAVSFVIRCETQEEVDGYWEKLTADGGAESSCGWVKDRFGLSWQVIPSVLPKLLGDATKAEKVMQAMMGMKKLEIEGLEEAGRA